MTRKETHSCTLSQRLSETTFLPNSTAEIDPWSHNKWKSFKTKGPLFWVQTYPRKTVSFFQWPKQRLFKKWLLTVLSCTEKLDWGSKSTHWRSSQYNKNSEAWEIAYGLRQKKNNKCLTGNWHWNLWKYRRYISIAEVYNLSRYLTFTG